jgi:hypothetical protein
LFAAFDASGIAMLWIGMILAVGLAAGMKFQAPSLTMPVALDIGRHVFGAFGTAELALTGLLFVTIWWRGERRRPVWMLFAVVVGLVLLQALWFHPALESRALAIMAGRSVQDGWAHTGYVVAEGLKLLALSGIATVARRL